MDEATSSYQSFLICFHADRADLYHNGLPIGTVRRGGEFEPYQVTMPDGTKRPAMKICEDLFIAARKVSELAIKWTAAQP